MATANPLKDEISCSVCFEIYQDPYVLRKCLHTLCQRCIKQIEEKGLVKCPQCRLFTNINAVTKDFKTQRLIDIHIAQHQDSTGGQPNIKVDVCGMCEESNKIITSHCEECDCFLCSGCEMCTRKEYKSHKVEQIRVIIKKIESECYKTMNHLKIEEKNIDKELTNIDTNITDIEESKTRQLADVKTFTEDSIQAMKDHEKRLEKHINDANDNLLNHLKRRRAMFIEEQTEIQPKMDLLENVIKSKDVVTLQEKANNVNQTIQGDISTIKGILSQNSGYIPSNVMIKKDPNWDVKGGIDVEVSDMTYHVLKSLYSDLCTHQYQCNKQVNLNYNPQKLCVINDQLWCVSRNGGLYVYGKDCHLVKEVKHDKISSAVSLTVSDTGNVIVACGNNGGLHQLSSSGKIHTVLKNGSFSDVACYNGVMYVLEYEQRKILVLQHSNNSDKWSEAKQHQLQHRYGDDQDRLCVRREFICVSTWLNNFVHIYDTQGQFIHKTGKCGNNGPGELKHPFLCDVDPAGNILVADCWNNRFQVCNRGGDWHVITLPGELKYPVDAVMGGDGELWIIQQKPWSLIKYTLNNMENIMNTKKHG